MMSRQVRIQLIAFVVLAAVGVVYAGVTYANLDRLVMSTTYTAKMRLHDSGGIFTNAAVTYQGVNVGRVGELHPTRRGVVVDLEISKDAPPIPADGLRAEVKSLSTIGELYVDLVPTKDGAPSLGDGSVIPVSHTAVPVPPERLLSHVNSFVRSVPRQALRTTFEELDAGFANTGPELERLLDASSTLVRSAQASLPETQALIRDGSTVLDTQNATAGGITAFSENLRQLSGQIKRSDPDLRRLIDTAPHASRELSALVKESGPGISRLTADALTMSRLTLPRQNALEQFLVTYPPLAAGAHSTLPGDGTVHFGLVLNVFNPLPCTDGYQGTPRRSGSETKDVPVNRQATCDEPRGSPIAVRGSQNAPHHGIPAAVPAPADGGEPRVTAQDGSRPSERDRADGGGSGDQTVVPVLPGPAGLADLPMVFDPANILER